MPGSASPPYGAHVVSVGGRIDVDCVDVVGNSASVSGTVTKVDSSNEFGLAVGDTGWVAVQDNGNPSSLTHDTYFGPFNITGVTCHNVAGIDLQNVTQGNITVSAG